MDRARPRSTARRLGIWTVGLLVVAASVGVAWGGTPERAEQDRLQAVRDAPDLRVEETRHAWVLGDADPSADRRGLVFYPGARVQAAAYLPTLAPLVRATDVRVVVPKLPLSLAVLDVGAARGAIAANPAMETWYVGGHSLGGAMACRFAARHPDAVAGVVLLAAYCPDDVSPTDLSVVVVTGARDRVLDAERFAASRSNLPPDATLVEIPGMTHAQFGAYGDQRGDGEPTIDDAAARAALTEVLVEFFEGEPAIAVRRPAGGPVPAG